MGLDMYLFKVTYVAKPTLEGAVTPIVEDPTGTIRNERVFSIKELVCYWRKANQIHNWFVANVQNGVDDCGEYYVGLEDLKSLLQNIKEVLANPDLASTLLPTSPGFFFGSIEYDDLYFDTLRRSATMLESILSEPLKVNQVLYYQSSW